MNKCKREAEIRFNKDAEPSNWYRAKLMLYYEQQTYWGGYLTYEKH